MFGPIAAAVAIATLVPPTPTAPPARPAAARAFDDAAFLRAVAAGGKYDARLGYLVGPQARAPRVRKLAACVVAHGLVGSAELKAAAESAGVELPTEMGDADRRRYEAFEARSGEQLEREYVRTVAERRAAAVTAFAAAARNAQSPDVRAFASRMLPLLKEHAAMAAELDR